jgi:DNA-binding NarL/FixJ family response regulator
VIRILFVEDHASFRQALETVLSGEPDLELVAQTSDGAEAVELAARSGADVAIVDLDVPGRSGVEVTLDLRDGAPDVRVLVLTALRDEVELGRVVEAGASAVLHKSVEIETLLGAVRRVAGGASLLEPAQTSRWLEALARHRDGAWRSDLLRSSLSPRELEVLGLLAEGLGNAEVGDLLGISPETVQTHVRNLMGKLDVRNRLEAVTLGIRLGLVPPPGDPVPESR